MAKEYFIVVKLISEGQYMHKNQKKLIKVFIFLFVVGYIVINWNDVSWLFNYKEISGLFYDFFSPYENKAILVSANAQVKTDKNISNVNYFNKNNSLEIPSIGIVTPVVIGESTDEKVIADELDRGAVYYPGSVLPGENGQIVILGHSAPPNWPKVRHDWIFSDINSLNYGDKIILYFNNTKYIYEVQEKSIIQKGQELEFNNFSGGNNILTMVSCWPPGKDYKRIAVHAHLIKK